MPQSPPPSPLLDAMLHAVILHLFFRFSALLIFIIPTHKSHMINSFWITTIKMIIIKINIIKGYAIKAYNFAKESNKIRV